MFKKTESLAWFVLLLSFMTCVGLTIGIPLGIRWGILNSNRGLYIVLQTRSGNVTHQQSRSDNAVLIPDRTEIKPGDQIQLTTDDANAVLLFYHPDEIEVPLATVQIYDISVLTILEAKTPRFASSELSHAIKLEINNTRNTQISLESNGRPVVMQVQTPDTTVTLSDGAYTFNVPAYQTDLVVREGLAKVIDPVTGDSIAIVNGQRTTITDAGLGEIYVGEYDIMNNHGGSFDDPLEQHWSIVKDRAFEDENAGSVKQTPSGDASIVLFTRVGQGFAEIGIEQKLNQDIRGAESLKVRARLRIGAQTLAGCGSLGTECPLMLAIQFQDETDGASREWLQGFYAINDSTGETFCHNCQWKAEHIQVPQLGIWYVYESPDLLPLLQEQGINPVAIESIYIYASGHTYDSAIDQIAILVGE